MKYSPFGASRNTQAEIDAFLTRNLFTGQKLDDTGLYYYGARYYDPNIGKFISADTIVPDPADPQSLNIYSYCLNNPLRYIDPNGHDPHGEHNRNWWTPPPPPPPPPPPVDHPTLLGYFVGIADIMLHPQEYSTENFLNSLLAPTGISFDLTPTIYDISQIPELQRQAYAQGLGLADITIQSIIFFSSLGLGIYSPSCSTLADNPLKNIKYTDKVLYEDFEFRGSVHSFPWIADNYGSEGVVSKITGGDGVVRTKVEVYGFYHIGKGENYRVVEGKFEWILEPDNTCNHRQFVIINH